MVSGLGSRGFSVSQVCRAIDTSRIAVISSPQNRHLESGGSLISDPSGGSSLEGG